MAKKKSVKKEELNEEVIEREVVTFENKDIKQTDLDKSIEELTNLVEEITPIDMTAELEEMKKEIFEEPVVKEESKKEEPKTVKEKITHKMNQMFGLVWNGMEYDD